MKLCKHLRWKGHREHREDPRRVLDVFALNEVPYSCAQSVESWGPDGGLACPERCSPDRRCYVEFYKG
ncbi:hypothetical protein L6R49_02545 [Myxococcota bacterium]|nr:hypothetical protein [Myxococcota bacterium]